jgi:hypothetical protein
MKHEVVVLPIAIRSIAREELPDKATAAEGAQEITPSELL